VRAALAWCSPAAARRSARLHKLVHLVASPGCADMPLSRKTKGSQLSCALVGLMHRMHTYFQGTRTADASLLSAGSMHDGAPCRFAAESVADDVDEQQYRAAESRKQEAAAPASRKAVGQQPGPASRWRTAAAGCRKQRRRRYTAANASASAVDADGSSGRSCRRAGQAAVRQR
jgi:hypothetical protein